MPNTESNNLYDYPKYYDLVFGSDWKAEFDFLRECFGRYSDRKVKRIFEPACGTGRLMVKLAAAGYEVAGNDLNARAVEYCNARLARHGFARSAVVGDMADFSTRKKYDAAFNMINSFRHLASERLAEDHLRCVADIVSPGGIYLLGLHLTPTGGDAIEEESWHGRRGNLAVNSRLWTIRVDRARRQEWVGMTFDVYTPTRTFRLQDTLAFRTYTAAQMQRLIDRSEAWSIAGSHDFSYCVDHPIRIGPATEDVVYVLKRK